MEEERRHCHAAAEHEDEERDRRRVPLLCVVASATNKVGDADGDGEVARLLRVRLVGAVQGRVVGDGSGVKLDEARQRSIAVLRKALPVSPVLHR